MNNNEYYRSFSSYLKEKYGEKVWRLPLDNGRKCPNRIDGKSGCSFCDGDSFLPDYLTAEDSLNCQLEKGRVFFNNRLGVKLFLGYFQANTNTYGSITELIREYELVLSKDYIAGLIISTRPDYVYIDIVKAIEELSVKYNKEIWIELGLQSIYDKTLERINRGHSYTDFCNAVKIIKEYSPSVKTAAHMILGLPGEDYDMMVCGNVKLFKDNMIDGVKYRPLDLAEGTDIYNDYINNKSDFMRFTDELYVNLICDILTRIPPETVIMRFANFKSFINADTDEVKYTKGTLLRKVELRLAELKQK